MYVLIVYWFAFPEFEFMVIICHMDPDKVPEEIDAIVDVYDWAVQQYDTEVKAHIFDTWCCVTYWR